MYQFKLLTQLVVLHPSRLVTAATPPLRYNPSTIPHLLNIPHPECNVTVFAYITIDHEPSDIVATPSNVRAFISKEYASKVYEDRLCWSISAPVSNPPDVDIYAGERQALAIVNFGADWIEFPSEDGWGTMGKTSRVFLRRRRYAATIKIVSKDTKAKEFRIAIDPDNRDLPITLL